MALLEAARTHLDSLIGRAGNVSAGLAELYDRLQNQAEPRKEEVNEHYHHWENKIEILSELSKFPCPENTNLITRPLRAAQINHYNTPTAYICLLADETKTLIGLIQRTTGDKKTKGGLILRNLEAFKASTHIGNTIYNDADRFISAYVGMLQTAYLHSKRSMSA